MRNLINLLLSIGMTLSPFTVNAVSFSLLGKEVTFSGFATAGFAISDQNYRYQRFITNDGTFKRDSVLGGQLDLKLNDAFSITTQAKLAPSLSDDQKIEPILTWAFVSWRPTNDLLFRGGRVRIPLYLNSANTDIGATFDFARLPTEIYSTTPTTDIDGFAASKTWNLALGELTLDGYIGTTHLHFRQAASNFPPFATEAYYLPATTNLYGLALTLQTNENIFRVSAYDTYTKLRVPSTFPFVSIMPGVGYYQVSNDLPGPGVPEVDIIHTPIYSVGADIGIGYGFRLMAEYVRRNVLDMDTSSDSQSAYLAILKPIQAWTPYVNVAFLRSMDNTLQLYRAMKHNVVPESIPGAALLNAAQYSAASLIESYDQITWAIGTSYRINSTSKLKAEWAITDIGDVSNFVDTPINEFSGNRLINVFSVSYSLVF